MWSLFGARIKDNHSQLIFKGHVISNIIPLIELLGVCCINKQNAKLFIIRILIYQRIVKLFYELYQFIGIACFYHMVL